MEENSNNESFTYTYSAKGQEEVRAIRQKYIPREEDKMEQLRGLDRSVTQKATVVSLIVGIIGALILGTGMSMVLVWELFFFGIVVGIIGMAGVALAFPLYTKVTQKERERLAPQIKALSDELLNQK